MTLRSPKHPSKSTTISRRLRNRADQNISTQPPELAHLKASHVHRAAASPSPRHISVDYQNEESHTEVWDPSTALDPFPRSHISNPSGSGLEQNAPPELLLSEPLDFPPYRSPQHSPIDLEALTPSELPNFDHSSTSTTVPPSPLSSLSGPYPAVDYEIRLSSEPGNPQDPSVGLQDMSTLGYMMPAQYGSMNHYGSPSPLEQQGYSSMSQQGYQDSRGSHQPHPATSGAYSTSYASAQDPKPILPAYQHSMPRSPYQQPLGPMRTSPAPMSYPPSSEPLSSTPHTYTYPAGHIPGQGLTPLASSATYPPPPLYPPSSYEMGGYSTLPPTLYPQASSTAGYPSYDSSSTLAPPTGSSSGMPPSPGSNTMPRVLNSRPKPQCWDHGCNGRQFSTFSNLLRHQREKSGTAAKSYCPRCGAEFTRTTARNGHMAHEKCKPRRTSDSSR